MTGTGASTKPGAIHRRSPALSAWLLTCWGIEDYAAGHAIAEKASKASDNRAADPSILQETTSPA
jgi:hypothetical protein